MSRPKTATEAMYLQEAQDTMERNRRLMVAFNAMRDVLRVVQSAPRTHPDRQGATYWQYNLIPRTIERIDAALTQADEVSA